MCIPNQNYLMDALDAVLTWDLPDEVLPVALLDQAKFMSGFDAEEGWHQNSDLLH